MNCNEVRDNLSLYLDDELNKEEKMLMDEHLKNCPECSKELKGYRKVIRLLNELPDEEPPEGYCRRLHEKLLETKANADTPVNKGSEASKIVQITEKRKSRRPVWAKYAGIAAALVLILLVYNLNNGTSSMNNAKMEMAYDTSESPDAGAAPSEAPQAESPTEQAQLYGTADYNNSAADGAELKMFDARGTVPEEDSSVNISVMSADARQIKIVKSGSLYVQTKDYQTFYTDVTAKVEALGGYIENNSTEVYQVYDDSKLLRGNMKIRIPQESFNEAVGYLEEVTDVRNKSISESDLTKEYYEKDNRLKNLEVQEQHLRELFDKATTVEEMLQIENELNRIRTEIDALNISLSDIDDRVSMSTISLEFEEVREANFNLKSEKGIWGRAKEGFINTVNSIARWFGNLVVDLISSAPILIPVVVIFVVLFIKIKKYWQKKL
jgi:hypothetical protein